MQTNWLWGYLIPIGILLLTWGGLPPHKARRITPLAALALALAVLGYWLVGYAFHLGGAHFVNLDDPTLAGLDALYANDLKWGLVGMTGFALLGDEVTPTALSLVLAYLPLISSAVLLLVLALAEARRWLVIVAGALAGAVVVPVAACWAWGSGWLAHLGETLSLGHGFADFGGSGLLLWLPAMMATGILLCQPRRSVEEPLAPPPAYFPLLANLGALLLGLGWVGWSLSGPFHTYGATLDWNRAALSVFLGMAGAVLTSQLYAWLVTGDIEPLMAARGMAAGWGAALAGAVFLPPWAALIVGLIAGLLFPLVLYGVEVGLRLKDAAAAVALGGVGGFWGLLSVGLLADGRWGQGWNGSGAETSLGVTGLFTGGGSGQLLAQLVGLLALGLWGLLWGALLGGISRLTLPRARQTPAAELAEEREETSPGDEETETQPEVVPEPETASEDAPRPTA